MQARNAKRLPTSSKRKAPSGAAAPRRLSRPAPSAAEPRLVELDFSIFPTTPGSDEAQSKFTDAVLDRFVIGYSCGVTLSELCLRAAVTSYDFRLYLRRHEEFAKRWAAAEELHTEHLEQLAVELAGVAGPQSFSNLLSVLKVRKPGVYRDNVKVEHSGSVSFATDFAAAMERVNSGVHTTQH